MPIQNEVCRDQGKLRNIMADPSINFFLRSPLRGHSSDPGIDTCPQIKDYDLALVVSLADPLGRLIDGFRHHGCPWVQGGDHWLPVMIIQLIKGRPVDMLIEH